MTPTWGQGRVPVRWLPVLLAPLSTLLAAGWAEAQVSVGVGPFGVGISIGPPQPSPTTDYLNRLAVVRAQAAYAERNRAMDALDNANAYYNKARDTTFFERYDPETRKRLEERVARRPVRAEPTPRAPATASRSTPSVLPLASFFDRSGRLAWPSEAPTSGDLGAKRTACDRATQVVLTEVNERGVAQVASATDARSKLLDYGRPALQTVRAGATPAVADTFHAFLLALYDSLGQAAVPRAPGP